MTSPSAPHRLRVPARFRAVALVALFGSLAVGGASLALSCAGDDPDGTRPEPPPAEVDAGEGDAESGCPESSPKVGENCRAAREDETCTYDQGTCEVSGQTYPKTSSYRCFGGNWTVWQPEKSPCDP
jgi:hypothetical protein